MEDFINLESIPKYVDGACKGKVNWGESVGKTINGYYKSNPYSLTILNYDKRTRYLFFKINGNIKKITTGNLQKNKLGSILGYITTDFRYEVNQQIVSKNRNYTIVDRKIEKRRHGKSEVNEKLYKYKCNICGFDGRKPCYINGIEKDFWVTEDSIRKGTNCTCCGHNAHSIQPGINDIGTTDSWMIPYFKNKNDIYKYSRCSENIIDFICPVCGDYKKYQIKEVTRFRTLPCSCSSNKMSFPEKMMFSILKQIDIDFIYQHKFDWMKFKDIHNIDRYGISDFVIPKLNLIIEMDGGFHIKDVPQFNQFAVENQFIDNCKDTIALENGFKTIRILSDKSNFSYIKNNIIDSELFVLLPLKNIDWKIVKQNTLSNITKEICEIKKKHPNMTVPEISKLTKYNVNMIRTALKNGSELGWCVYNISHEKRIAAKKCDHSHLKKLKREKEICQYSLDGHYIKTFRSISEAIDAYGVGIKDCLYDNHKSAYGYIWKHKTINYLDDIQPYETQIGKKGIAVICIDKTGNAVKFKSIREASKLTGVPETNISNCLKRKNQKTAGGYIWKYADEMENNTLEAV